MIVPFGYNHIDESESSLKPKLDWPPQEKSIDFSRLLEFEEDIEKIPEITEVEEAPQRSSIPETYEIEFQNSDEKKNQS